MTHDPMKSAAADAAATAAAFGARSNYAKGWEDALRKTRDPNDPWCPVCGTHNSKCCDDLAHIRAEGAKALEEATAALAAAESRLAVEASRADVAEQMVVELRGPAIRAKEHLSFLSDSGARDISGALDAALSRTEPVAGRWRKVDDIAEAITLEQAQSAAEFAREERDNARSVIAIVEAERDAAIARAGDLDARLRDRCQDLARVGLDNCHNSAMREASERARDEVGIQLAAAQERLRLAMGLRDFAEAPPIHWTLSNDRQTMTGECECGVATLCVDGRVEVRCTIDNALLARMDVHPSDGEVSGLLMTRQDSQSNVAAALLWSHRRSHRLDAVSAWDTVPGDALAKSLPEHLPGCRAVTGRVNVGYCMLCKVRALPPSPAGASARFSTPSTHGLALHAIRVGWDPVDGSPLSPPTSPAGASAPASGSTPAASSATSSGSEVEGSRCGQSGTRSDGLRAVAVSHLEALGVNTDNVKEKA